jgi:hypothetical protein
MQWFRSHIGLGARVALMALAFQLVLSFGHAHFSGPLARSLVAVQTALPSADEPNAPAGKSGLADQTCAICALLQLVGSAAESTSPALAAPALYTAEWQPSDPAFNLAGTAHRLFRARAPPLA